MPASAAWMSSPRSKDTCSTLSSVVILGFGLGHGFPRAGLSSLQRLGDLVFKASYGCRGSRVDAVRAEVGHHDRRKRCESPDEGPGDASEIWNQCITMGDP